MKKLFPLFCLVISVSAGSIHAGPSYTGNLSSTDGSLVVGGIWDPPRTICGTSLSWTVTETGPCEWHYEYTLNVPAPTITCLLIEASSTFTDNNLSNATSSPNGWADNPDVGLHLATIFPGIPEDLYGIAFCSTVDPVELTVEFDSDRCPVWGDFYATGFCPTVSAGVRSSKGFVYNAGFTSGDIDPLTGPHDGPELSHLLVPDSCPCVPVPGAFLLCGLGALLAGHARRRNAL